MIASPNLAGKTHEDVRRVIEDLVSTINRLDAQLTTAQATVTNLPAPLTLTEISQGLSATGAAPLDLTGLTGLPATP